MLFFGKKKLNIREAEDGARMGLVKRIDAVLSTITDNLNGVFYSEEERPQAEEVSRQLSLARNDLAEFLYSGDDRVLDYVKKIDMELSTVERRCLVPRALNVISECVDKILGLISSWRALI